MVWTAASKMGVRGLRRFLEKLGAAYPGRRVYLVWDNWPTHRHPDVLAKAEELGIKVLWLPTYAPWTNPIEKLWRWVRQEAVHHHRLSERWEELKGRVAAFLGRFCDGSPEFLRYVGLLPD